MRTLQNFPARFREPAAYLVCGGITTVINYAVYALCAVSLGLGVNRSNIIAWAAAVLAAFILSKLFVFRKGDWSPPAVLREALLFIGGRLFSGAVTIGLVPLLLWLGITQTLLGIPAFFAKFIAELIGIVLNFFLSKYAVFKS